MVNNILKEAYDIYKEQGFILNYSENYTKSSYVKGRYRDRKESQPYAPQATGWAGIIPDNLIIVDNDSYKEGNNFDKFIEDLGWKPVPFARTTSGGEHYAFVNPYPEKAVSSGKVAKKYKHIDIYSGYQSVIPTVGTQAFNKQGEMGMYEWVDPEVKFVVNPWDDNLMDMLELKDRTPEKQGDRKVYDNSVNTTLFERETEMPNEVVDKYLEIIPKDLHHDDWVQVGMALYDRYQGNDEGRAKWVSFCRASAKCDLSKDTGGDKWDAGHLVPYATNGITYKRLRSFALEAQFDGFIEAINKATENKHFRAIIRDISEQQWTGTRELKDVDARNALAKALNTRMKELHKDKSEIVVKQARSILKELQYDPPIEDYSDEVGKLEDAMSFKVYRDGNKFLTLMNGIMTPDLTKTTVVSMAIGRKIPKPVYEKAIKEAIDISGYKEETDYMLKEELAFQLEKSGRLYEQPFLHIKTNPLHGAQEPSPREDIVHDFYTRIWNGKAEDVYRIIGLTMRFKETKLNKLHLVAPTNTGKTHLLKHLGFSSISLSRLMSALRGEKGIGAGVIDNLKMSGLLLMDEVNSPLPQEVKEMDDVLHIDQFGTGGGTQIIKLHFTCTASTHKTAVRGMSDEMFNRLLLVELEEHEPEYKLSDSRLFNEDIDVYTDAVRQQARWILKDSLINPKYTRQDLLDLRNKYRLEMGGNDVDDLLTEISENIIEEFRALAQADGDVLKRNDEYFLKRKADLEKALEDRMREYSHIDAGKYIEKLMRHFISQEKKSVRVQGKPMKYYPLNLRTYYATADDALETVLEEQEMTPLEGIKEEDEKGEYDY